MTEPGAVPARDADRPTRLRMAGLHLRTGSLSLARAELEALAGKGALDEQALVDLAEARWRTGDLPGAGEAADALLATGREAPLALLIAAEAVSAAGRPAEARRLAGRALAAIDGPLDPVFAGMHRSLIWPSDGEPASPAGEGPGADGERPRPSSGNDRDEGGGVPEEGEPIAARAASHDSELARPAVRPPSPGPTSTAAASAYAGGRGALEAGDTVTAAINLAVALRLDPGFAQGVLDAVGDDPHDPSLALVAGDALRLLGRETEALGAFDRARGVAPPPELGGEDEAAALASHGRGEEADDPHDGLGDRTGPAEDPTGGDAPHA